MMMMMMMMRCVYQTFVESGALVYIIAKRRKKPSSSTIDIDNTRSRERAFCVCFFRFLSLTKLKKLYYTTLKRFKVVEREERVFQSLFFFFCRPERERDEKTLNTI